MTTKAKIALGLAGAAAAGVVLGLLLAPEKGTNTRKKIRKTAGGWADSLSHLFVSGKNQLEHAKAKGRHAKAVAQEKVSKLREDFS